MRHPARPVLCLALGLGLTAAACGGGGGQADAPGDASTPASTPRATSPGTTPGSTAAADATLVPEGTTELTAPPAGTLPQPIGSVVRTVPGVPGTTIVTLTGGDPAAFCPALDLAFPGSFVISLGGADEPVGAAIAEVAMAPVLAEPLDALAASAPRELLAPFVLWDDRNRQALEAFAALGTPADKVAAYSADLRAELARLQAGTSDGAVFDDLPATAARYGIDRRALVDQGTSFARSYGSFDDFFDQLSLDITLSPAVEAQLEQRFPCAADLASPDG